MPRPTTKKEGGANGRPVSDGVGWEVPRPFLKWAGGKGQLVPTLLELVPPKFKVYHEPFVGGGALFFALERQCHLKRARLSDINPELIDTSCALRDQVEEVIACLELHPYDQDYYYAIRSLRPGDLPLAERAARMIYLNRSGFNGLYRVNTRGGFNVPFGRHKNPRLCDHKNLRAASAALQGVEIRAEPFEAARRAGLGDLVYFDPPYVPVSDTAKFVGYAQDGFSLADQERLAEVFVALADRGVHVLLSNSDTPAVRRLYRGFRAVELQARRSVNSRSDRRGPVAELVVCSPGLAGRR